MRVVVAREYIVGKYFGDGVDEFIRRLYQSVSSSAVFCLINSGLFLSPQIDAISCSCELRANWQIIIQQCTLLVDWQRNKYNKF